MRALSRYLLAALGFSCLLCGGCELGDRPRQRSFPRLDPAQPFAESPAGGTGDETGPSPEPADSFEARLSSAAGHGQSAAAATVSFQRVVLGGGLVASLPERSGGWRWSRHGGITLAAHLAGGQPDALIYAEELPAGYSQRPSAAVDRFHHTVAPSLARSSWWPALGSPPLATLAAAVAARTELGVLEAEQALESLLVPTLGAGLGLRAAPGSFTGWKWVGRNRSQVEVRLGRLSGTWGGQEPPDEALRAVLEVLAEHSDKLSTVRSLVAGEGAETGATAASMVLGNATMSNRRGVHLAMLCRQTPTCPVAEDLIRFVASLEVAGLGEEQILSSGVLLSDFHNLVETCGLRLLSGDAEISPKDLAALAEQLQPAATDSNEPVDPSGIEAPQEEQQ